MIIYIDGDNKLGLQKKDFAFLDKDDEVLIYYASNNNYYTKVQNRTTLEESTKYTVNFIEVPSGKNAVDFKVAIDLSERFCNEDFEDVVICLISNDHHFQTISRLMQSKTDKAIISFENNLKDVIKYRFIEQNSLVELNNLLVKLFGNTTGSLLYNRLKKLFQANEEQRIVFKGERQQSRKNIKPIHIIRKMISKNRKAA